MQTREDPREGVATPGQGREGVLRSMGRTAVVVGSALLGSLLLIGVVAAMSVCWEINPLLMVAATAGLLLACRWILRLMFTTRASTGTGTGSD